MASIIMDVFSVGEYDAQEALKKDNAPHLIDDFMKGNGTNRIFVYYQIPYKITDSGEIQDQGSHQEFFVTDGEKVKLKGKGVYFFRTLPPGKPINPNG